LTIRLSGDDGELRNAYLHVMPTSVNVTETWTGPVRREIPSNGENQNGEGSG
jgi:hypothetical protein